jgi:hypothetical protein
MKNNGRWILLGFVLFVLGITSIIMDLVGVRWAFLGWLNLAGPAVGFLAKIILSMGGVLLIVLGRTDWDAERRDSSEP